MSVLTCLQNNTSFVACVWYSSESLVILKNPKKFLGIPNLLSFCVTAHMQSWLHFVPAFVVIFGDGGRLWVAGKWYFVEDTWQPGTQYASYHISSTSSSSSSPSSSSWSMMMIIHHSHVIHHTPLTALQLTKQYMLYLCCYSTKYISQKKHVFPFNQIFLSSYSIHQNFFLNVSPWKSYRISFPLYLFQNTSNLPIRSKVTCPHHVLWSHFESTQFPKTHDNRCQMWPPSKVS